MSVFKLHQIIQIQKKQDLKRSHEVKFMRLMFNLLLFIH